MRRYVRHAGTISATELNMNDCQEHGDNMARRERLDAGGGNYFSGKKEKLDFITSGSTLLDLALGGGWAERRIANVVGDKSTGKTLLCIEATANFAIKYPKGRIRYREAESAFDKLYAAALGMPIDRIDFGSKRIATVEDLTKICEKAKQKEFVVVDSLDALSDRSEMDRDIDEGSYGANKAKKMSELFRRLTQTMSDKDVTLLIVSQVRDKIGAMFGAKHTRTGGRAMDFYASQVLMLAHLGRIVKTSRGLKRATGVKILGKLDKNKISLPFREAEFPIHFGYGVDDAQSMINWLKVTKGFKAKNYGLSEEESKAALKTLLDMTRAEERKIMTMLREDVTARWYEIEKDLMPKRSKYA
jgi:recombination protein RecA